MFQPRISELIRRLEDIKTQHGDIEIQGYDETRNVVFDRVDAEFNNDEGTYCLITMDK
jgi:hypothetical protein